MSCTVCCGRVHLPGCTTKPNRQKDCCESRHKMLFDQGQTRGIDDRSFVMWSTNYPLGFHSPQI